MAGELPLQVIPWRAPEDGTIEVYANMAHIIWSIDDVTLRFATIGPSKMGVPGEPLEPVGDEIARVTIPWRLAKHVRDMLTDVIERYEKLNGPVRLDLKLPG